MSTSKIIGLAEMLRSQAIILEEIGYDRCAESASSEAQHLFLLAGYESSLPARS